jgi:predicted dehydrogenase
MNQAGQLCRKTASGIEVMAVPIEKREPLVAELEAFVACVRNRQSPVVTGEHASDALKLAVEICRHIRESPS